MTHAALAPLIDPKFDPFLAAPIGADRNDKVLSVLSALARSDVDPWREAMVLASMTRETAITRLAAIIAALPDVPVMKRPASDVAAELVALLPAKGQAASRPTRAGLDFAQSFPPTANTTPLLMAGLLALFLGLIAYRAMHEPSPEARPIGNVAHTTAPEP